ncbi:DNA-directed RNA polymerase III subunit RPC5-like [Saccostrea cucullata]|uniref:DNA-directed RNA polymerase III subunit RPC5-like n=1 Tax=Saccostrea cuccullata TaxID=36930 RepID=UPI002ED62CA1
MPFNMAEEDDPVLHEIDVFISKSLADKLYLLQYPVRPGRMTYDDVDILAARVKPVQKKVEIEATINTRSPHYARSKGEQIALNVDGAFGSSSDSMYSSDKMDKQVLTSVSTGEKSGRYAAGIFKDGELHLTPLNAIIQMRPSFSYLDRADLKIKSEVGPAGDGGESSQDEEEEVKPVTVKFAQQESEEAKARRMASFNYLQKKQQEEAWQPLNYHSISSGRAESERLQLYAGKGDELSEFQLQPGEYLQALMPETDQAKEEMPAMPSNVLSLIQLRTMPLQDQVKTLLTNAKVIRFSQLLALLPQGVDATAVLRSLQQVAVLVQGCWVVKSEILYPKEATSPHSGVSAEHLCRGRDYVMWRFTQSRHVTRKDIASIVKLPAEDVKDILEQISHIRVNCGWEFLFTYDLDFTCRYPDIVQRQKMLWEAKYQGLAKLLKIPKEHDKKFKDKEPPISPGEKPARRRRNSSRSSTGTRRKRTLSGRSLSDYSDAEMDAIKQDLENHDDFSSRKEEPMEVSSSKLSNFNGTLEVTPDSNCDTTKGENSSDSPEFKLEILNFVKEKLNTRFVVSASELQRLFQMHLAQSPPGQILATGVSDKMLEESALKVGGVLLQNQWPPNSQQEPIYALPKTGDKLDPARGVLLNYFTSSHKINRKQFMKLVEEQCGLTLSEQDTKLLLKDYCGQKGNSWMLKGTIPAT